MVLPDGSNLGFTTFQPSELAKILLILFFARFLMKHVDDLNDKATLFKYAALCGIPLVLIIAEPNLSTTICTALVLCILILYCRIKLPVYLNGSFDLNPYSGYLFKYCSTAEFNRF